MSGNQKNIVVSGAGGQGILFLGTILANAAMIENKNTTWIPSYGAEMRGGLASCFVVISDEEIASPIFDYADIGIFLSERAKNKYENTIDKNGLIIADSSLIEPDIKRGDIEYYFKGYSDLIFETDKKMLLNIVTLGSLIKKTAILKKDSVIEALKKVSKAKSPDYLELNLKSFEFGYSL